MCAELESGVDTPEKAVRSYRLAQTNLVNAVDNEAAVAQLLSYQECRRQDDPSRGQWHEKHRRSNDREAGDHRRANPQPGGSPRGEKCPDK